MASSGYGENLVHYNAHVFDHYWKIWQSENKREAVRVDLATLLPMTLGVPARVADPSSSFYRGLKDKSGLTKFGSALRAIGDQCLEPDEKSAKVNAEYAILHESLRGLTKEELLLIWTTELTQAEGNSQYRESHTNRAFRSIMFDGSPVLGDLGIEIVHPCEYLAGPNLELFFGKLQNLVKEGKEANIVDAVVSWADWAEDHEAVTGVLAEDCDHCKRILHSKVVSHLRSQKTGNGRHFTNRVAEICSVANGVLQNR